MKRIILLTSVVLAGIIGVVAVSFTSSRKITTEAASNISSETQRSQSAPPPRNPQRNAYFGDLHVHTGWSSDAFIAATRTTPDEAYRYAQGEAMRHVSGQKIQLKHGGLDFYAVTDHAEYLGVLQLMQDPNSSVAKLPLAADIISGDDSRAVKAYPTAFLRGPQRKART